MYSSEDLLYGMITTLCSPVVFAIKLYFVYIVGKLLIDYYKGKQ